MKLTPTPTLTLATALAAAIAGTAAAQTATPPTQAQPSLNYGQPQAASGAPANPAATPAATSPSPSAVAAMPSNADPQVREAQQRLQAAGLYQGPADGMMDPDTRAALANYQQQNGLQRTATLDQSTLARLMNNQTTGSGSTVEGAPMPSSAGSLSPSPMPAPMDASGGNAGKATSR